MCERVLYVRLFKCRRPVWSVGMERSGAEQHLEGGEHEEADADRKRELREYVLRALEAALSRSRKKSGQVIRVTTYKYVQWNTKLED